jgi:hypothetical protein
MPKDSAITLGSEFPADKKSPKLLASRRIHGIREWNVSLKEVY